MSVAKVQLTGGNFQDAEGDLLVDGYLTMRLSQDESVNDSQIGSGVILKIQLDGSGNVVSSPVQAVWGNDQMLPVNSFYIVTGFTQEGQIAFGPNNQQVTGNGGTFDVGTWIPNKVINWTPPLQVPIIEVNGTPLSSVNIANFVNSASVTFTDEGSGEIQATSTGGDAIKINGTALSASTANFENTPSVSIVDAGSGVVNFTANSLPEPDISLIRTWQPNSGASSAAGAWLTLLDITSPSTGGGGGSLAVAYSSPTAGAGAGIQFEANTDQTASLTGQPVVWPGRSTTFKTCLRFWNDNTSGVGAICFWGLTSVFSSVVNLPNSGDFVGVAISETSSVSGNILLVCSKAGAQTVVDSGVPATDVTGTSGIRYKIEVTLSSGVATLFINGVSTVTCNTNIPTVPLGLCWFQKADAGSNNVFTLTEYLSAENATL